MIKEIRTRVDTDIVSATPLISVILPSFNRGSVLPRAIESVLAQTESNLELIVVDDGSCDDTQALIAGIEDPRIRSVRGDRNRGANWARNRGIERARASLVSFLDSDDVYLPNKVEAVLALLAARPHVDLLVDSFVCRDRKAKPEQKTRKINPRFCTGQTFRSGLFERRISKATTALTVRKQALFEVGLFDEALARRQDLDIVLRLSRSHVCETTDAVLWEKHGSADAISNDPTTFLEASIAICDRHPEYLTQHADALYRDLRSHFSKLLKQRRWKTFAIDASRYRAHRSFAPSLLRLLLDARPSRPYREGSVHLSRKASGAPPRIQHEICPAASTR